MATIGKDIHQATEWLRKGELVGIPTETVYGLAGNAFSHDAVAKIFMVKNRPEFDPLIVHTAHLDQLDGFVKEMPSALKLLAEKFWPGPMTLILPKKAIIPDLVSSGLDTVGVRIPRHPLTLGLLQALDFPLAAPSANPFGYISPTSAAHVDRQLGDRIPYILDGGHSEVGLESTIIGMEKDQVKIYRLGGLDVKDIEDIVGPVSIAAHSSSNPTAPGMLKSHYAPHIPFVIGDLRELVPTYLKKRIPFAVLSFRQTFPQLPRENQFALSPQGDLQEAAKNLFASMRTLDTLDVSVILAELLPDHGLGRAINDRLKRAAAKASDQV